MIRTSKTRITQKGQVTIPKYIREYLGLKIENEVEFKIEKGKVIIQPAPSLEANFELLSNVVYSIRRRSYQFLPR
ncbi:MAG: AbrB/MazE/SpoVT family DNA-binding domain-containing protein [bacterium]